MTANGDPWRTLGLAPGASPEEIRRAYRRLAKTNHPDAAGEAALPRFLAIQAAYEALAGPGRGRRPGARPGPAASQREPWRADPDRARATGRADARGRPAPGARPAGGPGRGGAPGTGSAPGTASAPDRGGAPGASSGGTPRDDPPSGGRRSRPGEPETGRRPAGRRRPANRATPGSTSYDAADEDPFEPGWTGATWYGASSGTYWTINPKEYADPRKHGPEYQARARRSTSGGWIVDDDEPLETDPDVSADAADAADAGGADAGGADAAPGEPESVAGAARGPAAHRPSWTSAGRAADAERRGGIGAADPLHRPAAGSGAPDPRPADDGPAAPLLRLPATPLGRIGVAVLGWPPLGVAVATAIGESTGCGRFAASCGDVFSAGTWLAQVAIVLLLVALPRLAGWSAVGTLAALAAAIPTAVVLSAGGASRQPEASAGVLLAVLGLAYVAGVVWAIARQRLPRRLGAGRPPG